MLKKICNSLVTVLMVLAVAEATGPACWLFAGQPNIPKALRK